MFSIIVLLLYRVSHVKNRLLQFANLGERRISARDITEHNLIILTKH